jgi:striatin 1/3/4
MLEYALRMERSVFFFCIRQPTDACRLPLLLNLRMFSCHVFFIIMCNSSKQLTAPTGTAQPSKLATLQQQGAKDDVQSHKDGSSGSSPRSDGACLSDSWGTVYFGVVFDIDTLTIDSPLPSERVPNGTSAPPARQPSWPGTSANWSVGLPSVGSVGKPPPGRDPKSRARSRDYLKQ